MTTLACSSSYGFKESEMRPTQKSIVQPKHLLGQWKVALFFSPDNPPSETTLVITSVHEDGTLSGSFYQSEFTQARYTRQDECMIFSVITADGSGPYATSGKLCAENYISGQTLSTGRNFLMAWEALKTESSKHR